MIHISRRVSNPAPRRLAPAASALIALLVILPIALSAASSAASAATLEVSRIESEISTAAVVYNAGRDAATVAFVEERERSRGARGRGRSRGYVKVQDRSRSGNTSLGAGCGRSTAEANAHVGDPITARPRSVDRPETVWCSLSSPGRGSRGRVSWLMVKGSPGADRLGADLGTDMYGIFEGGRGPDIITHADGESDNLLCGGTLDPLRGIARDILGAATCRGEAARIDSGDRSIRSGLTYDLIRGGSGRDHILGTDNDDSLNGGDGDDTIEGGRGNDWLLGYGGVDTLNGGSDDDMLDYNHTIPPAIDSDPRSPVRMPGDTDSPQQDVIDGNDTLNGGDGVDTVGVRQLTTDVQASATTLVASNSSDIVSSVEEFVLGRGNDRFSGTRTGGAVKVYGHEGADHIDVTGNRSRAFNDRVECGPGADRVEVDFPQLGAPDLADGAGDDCESSNYFDYLRAREAGV